MNMEETQEKMLTNYKAYKDAAAKAYDALVEQTKIYEQIRAEFEKWDLLTHAYANALGIAEEEVTSAQSSVDEKQQ